MFQVVGKIIYNSKVAGFMVYNFVSTKLIRATLKDCLDEVRNNNIINLTVQNNALNVTDGSFSKLPEYDVNGNASANNLPVIIERVTHNGETVGYTLIDKGEYKKFKTAELVRKHSEFYNAKVVTKDNTTFISAKKGTFKELEIGGTNGRGNNNVFNLNEYVCKPEDYVIDTGYLMEYRGKDRKIRVPDTVRHVWRTTGFENVESIIVPEYAVDNELVRCICIDGDFDGYEERISYFKKFYTEEGIPHFEERDGFIVWGDEIVLMPDDDRAIYEIPKEVNYIYRGSTWYTHFTPDILYLHKGRISIDGLTCLSPRVLMFDDNISANEYKFRDDTENDGAGLVFSSIEKLELAKTGIPPKCKIVDDNIVSVDDKTLVLAPLGKMKIVGCLTVPNGVEVIGSEAYSMLTDESEDNREWLGYEDITVVMPDSVREINCGKDSQMKCAIGTIVANRGTYAEQWAKENGIKFISKPEFIK